MGNRRIIFIDNEMTEKHKKVVLKEMAVKSNLNLQRIEVTSVPNDCNFSLACDSKINELGMKVGKWPGRIKQRKEDTKNGPGSVRGEKGITTEYAARQAVTPLNFVMIDIPMGIGHLYTNDFVEGKFFLWLCG